MHIATHAVFRPVERHEPHIWGLVQDVDRGSQTVIYARGVGDEPHAFALEPPEVFVFQHLDAGLHANLLGGGGGEGHTQRK